ncbi:general secretion pathway protein GspB [Piscinibacter sp. Jin2]|uniref:General secretion pathway protein GspB n=1 Tax=Aquariibacter lacus TaxID=2801332 RepID=A0A9X1BQE5_9BURK|nr:general secretion pathway protein GspB [Piscinibacter lacus]MBL0718804.1 general secretion pathway protein GspB [Piscinibacter lacus]
MSTILDALRRAEAERQRGQAPSRDAVTRLPPPPQAAPGAGLRPGLLLASLGGAGLVAVLAWAFWPDAAPQAEAPAQAAAPRSLAPISPAAPSLPADSPPPPGRMPSTVPGAGTGFQALPFDLPPAPGPGAAAPPARARAPAPAPAGPAAPAAGPVAGPSDTARPAPGPTETLARPAPARMPAAGPAPVAAAAATAPLAAAPSPGATPAPPVAPAPAARPLREQPAGLQAALQGQRIDGVVHAEDPASRLLIVNGQIRHEGDRVAEGVQIERIEPGVVLLRWQGGLHALRP